MQLFQFIAIHFKQINFKWLIVQKYISNFFS